MKIKLSEKQKIALDLLDDPQVTEVYFGGSAGGGKTLLLCIWILLQCRNYPGIRIGLGRKELTRLKQTTVVSLLREAHRMLEVTAQDYNFQDQKGLITYANSSSIQLLDLVRQPSDPDFDTLGSLNLTHAVIDEGGEIVKKAKDVLGSRVNRFLNDEYNITGKLVITGNPSQNFTRDEYYEPYMNAGAGDYQKWATGSVYVNDKELTAYRAFVKSLPTDNPFLPKNYIERLKQLPDQERKRLYEGNWDYMDDENSLFKAQLLDRAVISDIPEADGWSKYIGVDIADKGKDKTVATLIVNGVITEQQQLSVETVGEKAISEATAMELIKFAQQRGFTDTEAKFIAVESNGVGVGVRDFMRSRGWYITEYTATAQSRSKGYYDLSTHFDSGQLKIKNDLDSIAELRKQLLVLTYEFDDKLQPKVLEKKKVKEVLGYSPDFADSLMVANYVRSGSHLISKRTAKILF